MGWGPWVGLVLLSTLGCFGCFGAYVPLAGDESTTGTTQVGSTSVAATSTSDDTTGSTTSTAATVGSSSEPVTGTTGEGSSTGALDCECPNELDVLIVFDTLFVQEKLELSAAFLQLATELPALFGDFCGFHIGFTTTRGAPSNDEGCQGPGALVRPATALPGCGALADQPFLDQLLELDDATCFAGLLAPSDLPHQPVNVILQALAPSMNGADDCNQGFFRPEVPLYIVLLTATDDVLTPGTPAGWALQILQANTPLDAGAPSPFGLALFAGTETDPGDTDGGSESGGVEEPLMCPLPAPERLLDLANSVPADNRFIADPCASADVLSEAFVSTFDTAANVCTQRGE